MARKPWHHEGSRHQRGYGAAWVKTRQMILARDKYLCQPCLAAHRYTLATQVDHIKPKAEGGTDAHDNLQAICALCHDRKTEADAARAQGRNARRIEFDADGRPVW